MCSFAHRRQREADPPPAYSETLVSVRYEKSVALNPKNTNGTEALAKLKSEAPAAR